MLGYAVKLSLEPWNMEEADVQELRDLVSVMPVYWTLHMLLATTPM